MRRKKERKRKKGNEEGEEEKEGEESGKMRLRQTLEWSLPWKVSFVMKPCNCPTTSINCLSSRRSLAPEVLPAHPSVTDTQHLMSSMCTITTLLERAHPSKPVSVAVQWMHPLPFETCVHWRQKDRSMSARNMHQSSKGYFHCP